MKEVVSQWKKWSSGEGRKEEGSRWGWKMRTCMVKREEMEESNSCTGREGEEIVGR
jgi:hypothetical protein